MVGSQSLENKSEVKSKYLVHGLLIVKSTIHYWHWSAPNLQLVITLFSQFCVNIIKEDNNGISLSCSIFNIQNWQARNLSMFVNVSDFSLSSNLINMADTWESLSLSLFESHSNQPKRYKSQKFYFLLLMFDSRMLTNCFC